MSGQPAHVGEPQRIVGVGDRTVGDDQDRFPRRIAADGLGARQQDLRDDRMIVERAGHADRDARTHRARAVLHRRVIAVFGVGTGGRAAGAP